jgi:hypothetical protein
MGTALCAPLARCRWPVWPARRWRRAVSTAAIAGETSLRTSVPTAISRSLQARPLRGARLIIQIAGRQSKPPNPPEAAEAARPKRVARVARVAVAGQSRRRRREKHPRLKEEEEEAWGQVLAWEVQGMRWIASVWTMQIWNNNDTPQNIDTLLLLLLRPRPRLLLLLLCLLCQLELARMEGLRPSLISSGALLSLR